MVFERAFARLCAILIEQEYRAWTRPFPTHYCDDSTDAISFDLKDY